MTASWSEGVQAASATKQGSRMRGIGSPSIDRIPLLELSRQVTIGVPILKANAVINATRFRNHEKKVTFNADHRRLLLDARQRAVGT